MELRTLLDHLECFPIIASVREIKFAAALECPADVLFYLDAKLSTVAQRVRQAHEKGKILFVHIDLAEGIGKDKEGLQYLASIGVDGVISTRSQIIRMAKELQLLTVQRFFALDSQGLDSMQEMVKNAVPHMMEIMPGIIPKVIRRFSEGTIPVIAGGLINQKQEITAALTAGATAISTGCKELWYE